MKFENKTDSQEPMVSRRDALFYGSCAVAGVSLAATIGGFRRYSELSRRAQVMADWSASQFVLVGPDFLSSQDNQQCVLECSKEEHGYSVILSSLDSECVYEVAFTEDGIHSHCVIAVKYSDEEIAAGKPAGWTYNIGIKLSEEKISVLFDALQSDLYKKYDNLPADIASKLPR